MSLRDEHEYAVWTAEWKGGLATDVSGRGHAIRVDEPKEFGGEDSGPMPTELRGRGARLLLLRRDRVGRAQEAASRWTTSRCRCSPTGRSASRATASTTSGSRSSTPAEVLAPAVELAKRYCWVTNTLAHPPEIRYHLDEPIR